MYVCMQMCIMYYVYMYASWYDRLISNLSSPPLPPLSVRSICPSVRDVIVMNKLIILPPSILQTQISYSRSA